MTLMLCGGAQGLLPLLLLPILVLLVLLMTKKRKPRGSGPLSTQPAPFPNEVDVRAALVMWDTCTILRCFFRSSFRGLSQSVFDELRQQLQSRRVTVFFIVLRELARKLSVVHNKECVDEKGVPLKSEEDWLNFLERHGAVIETCGGFEPVTLATNDPYDAAIAGHAKHLQRVLFTLDNKIRGCDSVTTFNIEAIS